MPSSAEIHCVDPEIVFKFWPYAKRFVFSASERTGLTDPEETEYGVLIGDQLLWIIWDGTKIKAAATTHLCEGVCTVTTCGGEDMKQWLPLFSRIVRYAEDEGCIIRIPGRKGWKRALQRSGLPVDTMIFEGVV